MKSENRKGILKQTVNKSLAKMATKVAEFEVNSSCPLFAYQPNVPDSVKKLRKF